MGEDRASVPRRNDSGVFDHEDYRAFPGARAVQGAFGDDKTLSWCKVNGLAFQIDQQSTFDHIKEFIITFVFVPVIFAFYNAHPHHRLVHLAQRLVVPLVRARVGESLLIDHFQGLKQDV